MIVPQARLKPAEKKESNWKYLGTANHQLKLVANSSRLKPTDRSVSKDCTPPQVLAAVDRDEPAWQKWMGERFPMPTGAPTA
jgi:hypothetical protein